MQRLTAYISGKVQKTGYRARVLTIARDFGLKGYVQNLDDGRVKVVAEGETGDLESLLGALDIKNTIINVVDIKSEYSSATGILTASSRLYPEARRIRDSMWLQNCSRSLS